MMSEAEVLEVVAAAGRVLADALRGTPQRATVFTAIDDCLAELATTGIWGTANRVPSGKLWALAGDSLQHGALLHRARFKPRGYAGDDEMLRLICENWRCDHPLGALLDDYFQSHAAPQAVRNRTQIVADAIVEGVRNSSEEPFAVTSVGSGPAIDVLLAAEKLSNVERARLRVNLLDLDPQALDASEKRFSKKLLPENVTAVRENLYRLATRPSSGQWLTVDLVACTGFFDYLNDTDAVALLGQFWRCLPAGGRLIVFNFAPANPSRALMEWIGNWYLVYRDQDAMHSLAKTAGIPPDRYHVNAEAQGIDLFIDARKPN
jgi:extracellular factor (EF) 3-hydroxypalmitic acid methyl ester biosynthesis protein